MLQFSIALLNAMLDAMVTAIGTNAILVIYSGAEPANVAAARTGTVLATLFLPNTYLAPAAGGSKTKAGTWETLSVTTAGAPGYFTVFASDGVTAHIQGTCTFTGAGGDMTVDQNPLVVGQDVTVTGWTLTGPNQ